jgi:hypothetical protein
LPPKDFVFFSSILNKLAWWFASDLQLLDGGRRGRGQETGAKRGDAWTFGATGHRGQPAPPRAPPPPPPLSSSPRCATPPAHAWSRQHPLAGGRSSASQPPVELAPVGGGWSRLGASSRPQIGRWDRRQCHMPDFWVTGRPINPLNACAATFCAAGVISMHQTPPGMARAGGAVSGVWGLSGAILYYQHRQPRATSRKQCFLVLLAAARGCQAHVSIKRVQRFTGIRLQRTTPQTASTPRHRISLIECPQTHCARERTARRSNLELKLNPVPTWTATASM